MSVIITIVGGVEEIIVNAGVEGKQGATGPAGPVGGLQPGDNVSELVNDVPYLSKAEVGTLYINSLADLSSFLDGSVYELPAGSYTFVNPLDFGNTTIDLITLNGCYYFRGLCLPLIENSSTSPLFTSTTTGILFQGTDFFLSSPNGTGIDLTGGNSVILDIVPFFNCKLAMDIDDFDFITLNEQPIISCEDGIIANNIGTIAVKQPQFNSGLDLGGKYITLSGASSGRLILLGIDSQPEVTESFLRIDPTWGGDAVISLGIHSTTSGGDFFDISAGGRDQEDSDILSKEIKNVEPSHYVAAAFVNANTTVNPTITNTVFTDMAFGTGGSALVAGSTMERWSLVDEVKGIFEYEGKEPFHGSITFDFTVESSGGSQDFLYKWEIDTGSGFGDLPDPVEALVNVGSNAQSFSKTFPLRAVIGDQIKPQITRSGGNSGITTTYATIFVAE